MDETYIIFTLKTHKICLITNSVKLAYKYAFFKQGQFYILKKSTDFLFPEFKSETKKPDLNLDRLLTKLKEDKTNANC